MDAEYLTWKLISVNCSFYLSPERNLPPWVEGERTIMMMVTVRFLKFHLHWAPSLPLDHFLIEVIVRGWKLSPSHHQCMRTVFPSFVCMIVYMDVLTADFLSISLSITQPPTSDVASTDTTWGIPTSKIMYSPSGIIVSSELTKMLILLINTSSVHSFSNPFPEWTKAAGPQPQISEGGGDEIFFNWTEDLASDYLPFW